MFFLNNKKDPFFPSQSEKVLAKTTPPLVMINPDHLVFFSPYTIKLILQKYLIIKNPAISR